MPAFSAHNIVQRDMMSKLNTDTNDWSILALTGSWCFLAVLVVAMRIYTRTVMVRYLGLDDIFTVGTMVAGVAVWACFVGESHWALGRHMEDITPTHMKMYYKWQFAHSMLQLWSLYGMRVAFMLFLLRLSSSRIFRITLFAIVGQCHSTPFGVQIVTDMRQVLQQCTHSLAGLPCCSLALPSLQTGMESLRDVSP